MKNRMTYFVICLLYITPSSGHTAPLNDDPPFVAMTYDEIKKECEPCVYWYYSNLDVLPWPYSFSKEQLKIQLEWFLLDDVNTVESRKLHAKYEALNWDIREMMMHWSE